MKIQSKDREFYDWALGVTGIDEAVFWDRIPFELHASRRELFAPKGVRGLSDIQRRAERHKSVHSAETEKDGGLRIMFEKTPDKQGDHKRPLSPFVGNFAGKPSWAPKGWEPFETRHWSVAGKPVCPNGTLLGIGRAIPIGLIKVSILGVPFYALFDTIERQVHLRLSEVLATYDQYKAQERDGKTRKQYEDAVESAISKSPLIGDLFDRGDMPSFDSPSRSLLNYHEILRTPVISFSPSPIPYPKRPTLVRANENLTDLGFAPFFPDALDLFQRISQFMALTESPDMAEIKSDKTKREKHGFHDMSFKKRPQN